MNIDVIMKIKDNLFEINATKTQLFDLLSEAVDDVMKLKKENESLKEQIEELKDVNKLLIYKENYEMLKKEIESLQNAFLCCEMTLDFNKEVEEI